MRPQRISEKGTPGRPFWSSNCGFCAARIRRAPFETPMKRILVADDSPISRELMREILELEGFEVVEASDGSEALSRLRQDHFDLVLLDIQMPRKDGYTVVRELRAD